MCQKIIIIVIKYKPITFLFHKPYFVMDFFINIRYQHVVETYISTRCINVTKNRIIYVNEMRTEY